MQNSSNENINKPNRIIYYLALGSNMGNRAVSLKNALEFLEGIGRLHSESSVYETEPVDMAPGTRSFYNMVVCFHSRLTPSVLLSKIKEFEAKMGRAVNLTDGVKSNKKDGSGVGREIGKGKPRVYLSRPLDIDILLAEERIISFPGLTVPHERMTERAFVLLPLNEIAPSVIHPVSGKTITQLLASLGAAASAETVKMLGPVHRLARAEPEDL